MDHALSYVYAQHKKMIGGDSLYNRMSATHQMFRESQDTEFEYKVKKVSDRISESMNIIANEPSLAFFRVQEHVRKSLPQLVEQKHEVENLQQNVQGAGFDTEYAANTVRTMQKSAVHFQNIQDLLKNAMFMKQQIDYKEEKKEQEKMKPNMYRTSTADEIAANITTQESSSTCTESSAIGKSNISQPLDTDEEATNPEPTSQNNPAKTIQSASLPQENVVSIN